MRIYVSGGMTGWPDNNEAAFDLAEHVLKAMGHDVTTPVELGREDGEVLAGDGFNATDEEYENYLGRDLALITRERFDAVVFIQGWRTSGGAGREGRKAIEQGLRLYTLEFDKSARRLQAVMSPITNPVFLKMSRTERLRKEEIIT